MTAPDTSLDAFFTDQQREQGVLTPKCPKRCGGELVWNEARCSKGCDLEALYETWARTLRAFAVLRAEAEAERRPPKSPELRSHLLGDFLSNAELMAPPLMLVVGFLRVLGITLFHGREKLGKSTFIAQLVAAITTGRVFLGEALEVAFVVWVAADEAARDAADKLQRFGARPDGVLLVDGRRSPHELADEIAKAREYAGTLPIVVIVDTLAELVSPMITNENDSAPMIKALRQYIDVIRAANAACVLIHHSNKAGSDYRGSQAIGGIVDAIAQFRERHSSRTDPTAPPEENDDPTDTRRVLEVRSRWAGREKRHLTYVDGHYVLGDAPTPLPERILIELRQSGGSSGSRLAERLGAKKQAVLSALRSLEDAKQVHTTGTGRFTAYVAGPPSAGTAPEPLAQAKNTNESSTGTEAEPQGADRASDAVPDLRALRGAREPEDDEGYWRSLEADEATLERLVDAA